MTLGLVLHDLGDPAAGAGWRAALSDAGIAAWSAPDLPGHGSAPAPGNGAYDPMAAVTIARRALGAGPGDEATVPGAGTASRAEGGHGPSVVVGVGENALAAVVLAVGGGCSAIALVDGLHGPFRDPVDEVASIYATVRAIAADPAATGRPPPRGLDPRTAYGYGVTVSSSFLRRLWAAITVPVLVVETPSSRTPAAERAERAAWFGGPTTFVEVVDAAPATVAPAIAAWVASEGL